MSTPADVLIADLQIIGGEERDARVRAELADAYRRGLEDAAKLAETWGSAPPNPRGRRARLAAEIRSLASEKP